MRRAEKPTFRPIAGAITLGKRGTPLDETNLINLGKAALGRPVRLNKPLSAKDLRLLGFHDAADALSPYEV